MSRIFNRKDMQSRRRGLRRRATAHEKILYAALRGRQLGGAKFRFNPSIGHYVVDFYCPKRRLVVELDGSQHETELGRGNDRIRTAYLESIGIRVLRFRNAEIEIDLEGVLTKICSALTERA